MADKVQKIRKEVEKLHGNPYYMMAVKDALAIIDSLQEEPSEIKSKCMYTNDSYTDEDRKVLCDGCEEECKYNKKERKKEPSIPDIVDEHFYEMLGEEPVSEDLEEAVNAYIGYAPEVDESSSVYGKRLAFKAGAKWQKQQDQSTIELAEDHAMLAGMEKMKEQLVAKAVDAHCFGFQGAALFSFRLPASNYLVGSEVKVIVIKED